MSTRTRDEGVKGIIGTVVMLNPAKDYSGSCVYGFSK
jgi:hypothetical protein